MIVSESSIRQWADLPERQQIIEDLTMLGLEVDGVEPVAGEFSNVVVGEVIHCEQHPDADKLRVTKVKVAEDEILDIVCGAPNCRTGLKVCVAKVGAVLPGDFKIKPAKLRGVPSNGMLCSFSELGVNIEQDGIVELDANAVIGTDVREYLDLNNVAIEIGLTANRADCLSQVGVARDLLAKYAKPFTKWNDFVAQYSNLDQTSIADKIEVEIKNPVACPAYASRVIRGVNVNAKTPDWMVQALARYGVRSIDPLVDITNYILHELGQPLHAFDYAKIDNKIVVRDAVEGEKLVLLSEQEIAMKSNTLVIADANKALALAGIFGGLESGVTSETKDIVLEVAHFAPLSIINRAREYGLHTDASHRFERGVDPQLIPVAMEYATKLVLDLCGGQAGPVNLAGNIPSNTQVIELDLALVDRVSGINFTIAQVAEILSNLGCKVLAQSESQIKVETPSWRFDLSIPEDLVEEVIRIYGYEKIPTEAPYARLEMSQHHEEAVKANRVKALLVDRNFQEVITYSFVNPNQQVLFHNGEENLTLPNPISVEMSEMRLSLFSGLLNTLSYNLKRQQKDVRIFESGLVFIPNAQAEIGVEQKPVLGGLITGSVEPQNWSKAAKTCDFYDAKGVVEDILALTKVGRTGQVRYVASAEQGFHPAQTAAIFVGEQKVGVVGKLHPSLQKPFGVSGDIFLFQLDNSVLETTVIPVAVPVSKYQANKRDIALVVDQALPVGDLLAHKVGTELLQSVELFDVYQGENLEAGKKSIALKLTIGSNDKTLSDDDINEEVNQVLEQYKQEFNAVLREV